MFSNSAILCLKNGAIRVVCARFCVERGVFTESSQRQACDGYTIRRWGAVRIEGIKLNLTSRDDIPALLPGLQHLYREKNLRDRLFGLLEEYLFPGIAMRAGRPGMDMWKILRDGGHQAGERVRCRPVAGAGEQSHDDPRVCRSRGRPGQTDIGGPDAGGQRSAICRPRFSWRSTG